MIRNLFRDLLGSPLDPTERSAMFINDESNLRQRIVEYEKRMCEMKEIAARQAQDIQDLRQVNDTSIEKAVEASSADLTSPLGLHILTSPNGSRRSPASGSERWRSALQEATEQQQQAISRGQQELRDLASKLQGNYEAQSKKQAEEWKGVLKATNEARAPPPAARSPAALGSPASAPAL